jgi:hypothetical protein
LGSAENSPGGQLHTGQWGLGREEEEGGGGENKNVEEGRKEPVVQLEGGGGAGGVKAGAVIAAMVWYKGRMNYNDAAAPASASSAAPGSC